MSKKNSIIFGIIFMAAILAVAIWISIKCSTKDIVGTFCTGEEVLRENIYISFFSDNTLLIYRQLGPGASGIYKTNKYEHISALDLEMTDGRQTIAIFDNHDTLILVEEFIEDVAYPIEFKSKRQILGRVVSFLDLPYNCRKIDIGCLLHNKNTFFQKKLARNILDHFTTIRRIGNADYSQTTCFYVGADQAYHRMPQERHNRC